VALDRRIRGRAEAGLLQHAQRVEFAGRLDDPGEHQSAEHLVPAGGDVQTQRGEPAGQGISQVPHPGRGDRQRRSRPGRRAGLVQTEVKLALTCLQTLPGNSFQQLQLGVIMRRPDVLDVP